MQNLGFAFRGLAIAKAPFGRSSGSKDTNTYPPELVLPRSPFKVLRTVAAFLNWGLKGPTIDSQGYDPCWGREPRIWCQRLVELWTTWQFLPCGAVDRPPQPPLGNLILLYQVIAFIIARATFPTNGTNCKVSFFRSSPAMDGI